MPDETDPLYIEYLIDTGNSDMIGSSCTCCCCKMVTDWFPKWKAIREDEKREKKSIDGEQAAC